MLAALGAIVDGIGTALSFVVSFFRGFVSLFTLIGQSMTFLSLIWTVVPSVLLVFGVAGIGVVIVLHILGR